MRSAAVVAVLALAACGGGGGGGSTASTVPNAHPTAAATPAGPTAQVTLRIDTSTITTSSATRSPKFISPNTQSVTVALQSGAVLANVNITPSSPSCVNGTCTITLSAPVGSDTFVITTWDGPGGTGNQLSTATTLVTVVANTTNTIAIALGGVVTSATAILGSSSVQAGTPATVSVTVAAYDIHNNLIIGPGNYSSPVTLTNSDASGVTHLSAPQIVGPGATVNLIYSGGSIAGATITPFVGSTPGTAATFAPSGYGFADFNILGTNAGFVDAEAPGPDGNVWFAGDSGQIGFVTPTGTQMVFNTGSNASTNGLATAPNGVIWFGDDNDDLGSISTDGNTVNYLQTIDVEPNTTNCELDQSFAIARRAAAGKGAPAQVSCGPTNWMAPGPDGNLWFSDDSGFIGNITPLGVAKEWDITQLNGWTGGSSDPEQFTFGSDGNIYAADASGFIDKITVAGGTPGDILTDDRLARVLRNSTGVYGLAIAADNTLWTGDQCSNLFALPLGNPIVAGNFNASNVQSWSIAPISAGNSLGLFAGTPGGVFAIDFSSAFVYRINEVTGTTPLQPALTTFTPVTTSASGKALTLGPDTNLWVGFTISDGDSDPMARVAVWRTSHRDAEFAPAICHARQAR